MPHQVSGVGVMEDIRTSSDGTTVFANSDEPMSVDAFERKNPALVGMMRRAVREELEAAQANGTLSGNVQCPLDLGKVAPDVCLVFSDSLDGIGKCDDCSIRVAPYRERFGILCGINRFPVHMITSLLAVGGIIIASAALLKQRG